MRHVQLRDEEFLAGLAADAVNGEDVTLFQEDRPVARIIPFQSAEKTHASRMAAVKRLDTLMAQAQDFGIVWNGRDELYDRT